jgi:hypothetical protein
VNLATPFRSLLVAAALTMVASLPARAQIVAEGAPSFFGNLQATPDGAALRSGQPSLNLLTTVYDNTASAPNFGFSSTDLASTWGDELFLTGSGILQSHKFTIFNTGGGGNLLTATVGVSFFNAITSAPLGSYSTSINFGAGLPSGSFSTVTVSGIAPALINLNVADIIVTQQVLALTGTPARLGIASQNPPTVGTSPATMFINSSTVGPAGFYTIGASPANPGYQVNVDVVAVPTRGTSWGRVKGLYR